MKAFSDILVTADRIVWGPVMLFLLVGTGIFLTIRTGALCWRNLPYALKSVLRKDARRKKGAGDVSPFSALTTALAATIGTGNIVGVATAMVSGGPGALVWMWISAAFGLTSKFGECMLAIKYREVNERGEMSGGPMYTLKKGFPNQRLGALLGWLFALFAVIASFGIGNLTQANSISSALHSAFRIPAWLTGILLTLLALLIIPGGIKSISRVSQVVVPLMAVFYMLAGLMILVGNRSELPAGIAMIFRMAFSVKAVGGGLCGSLTASMTGALRYGVARGVFSNEAGMGSAAITAAAASTDDPVRQGYINMTGTFWDTLVVCTITGLCIASSGVLGSTAATAAGTYYIREDDTPSVITFSWEDGGTLTTESYFPEIDNNRLILTPQGGSASVTLTAEAEISSETARLAELVVRGGVFFDSSGNEYCFSPDGTLEYREPLTGAALTIAAFETVLGRPGGWLVCIGIVLFAFSTILGWEYHGEKAFEYLVGSHKLNMLYRILFSLMVYVGAVATLQTAWSFSDIANALMALPNLICLLALNGEIRRELTRYQKVVQREKRTKRKG